MSLPGYRRTGPIANHCGYLALFIAQSLKPKKELGVTAILSTSFPISIVLLIPRV